MSRQPLVQNGMLYQRHFVPKAVRLPWQVLKEHVQDDGVVLSAQLQACAELARQVGYEKAFASLPPEQQKEFIDISNTELVAFVLWRRQQKNLTPQTLADSFDCMPPDDQASFTAPASEHEAILKEENMFFDLQEWSSLQTTLADSESFSQAQDVVHATMACPAFYWPRQVASRYCISAEHLDAAGVCSLYELRKYLLGLPLASLASMAGNSGYKGRAECKDVYVRFLLQRYLELAYDMTPECVRALVSDACSCPVQSQSCVVSRNAILDVTPRSRSRRPCRVPSSPPRSDDRAAELTAEKRSRRSRPLSPTTKRSHEKAQGVEARLAQPRAGKQSQGTRRLFAPAARAHEQAEGEEARLAQSRAGKRSQGTRRLSAPAARSREKAECEEARLAQPRAGKRSQGNRPLSATAARSDRKPERVRAQRTRRDSAHAAPSAEEAGIVGTQSLEEGSAMRVNPAVFRMRKAPFADIGGDAFR